MEIAQGFPRNGTVPLRLKLAAAPAGPMITEYGPGPGIRRAGFEVNLHDLTGGIAAHDHVEKHRIFKR
jgi:hypothetical protein